MFIDKTTYKTAEQLARDAYGELRVTSVYAALRVSRCGRLPDSLKRQFEDAKKAIERIDLSVIKDPALVE